MTACDDNELFHWLQTAAGHNLEHHGAGDFLRNLAEAGLRADCDNYRILRPVLLTLMAKYPEYGRDPQ